MKKYIKSEKAEVKKKEKDEEESQSEKNDPEIAHNYKTRRNRHNPDDAEIFPPPEEGRKIPVQRPIK